MPQHLEVASNMFASVMFSILWSRRVCVFLTILTLGVGSFFCATAVSADEDLCKRYEVVIAKCSFLDGKKKMVSFCLDPGERIIHYRYGSVARIELSVDFSESRRLYRWVDRVTHVTFLGFNREGYSYVLGIPQETYGAKAFMFVKGESDPIDFSRPRLCRENSFGQKDSGGKIVQELDDDTVRKKGFRFP